VTRGAVREEQGALLAELMVAVGLLALGVLMVGTTLSGPIRGLESVALPVEGFEGLDRAGLAFVTAVRAARPTLTQPAVLVAEPGRVVLSLGHLVPREGDSGQVWSLTVVEDTLVLAVGGDSELAVEQVVLRNIDPSRTSFSYLSASRDELDSTLGLSGSALARVSIIELGVVVLDPTGRSLEVEATLQAALRLVGPLA
jgi:hypothetical protein